MEKNKTITDWAENEEKCSRSYYLILGITCNFTKMYVFL